jgi:hypothetical protein
MNSELLEDVTEAFSTLSNLILDLLVHSQDHISSKVIISQLRQSLERFLDEDALQSRIDSMIEENTL